MKKFRTSFLVAGSVLSAQMAYSEINAVQQFPVWSVVIFSELAQSELRKRGRSNFFPGYSLSAMKFSLFSKHL